MSQRGDRAKALFMEGYNCTQSVAGAFADKTDIPFDTLMRMASPFGGGMGGMRHVCGTFSGLLLILGLTKGYDDPKAREDKKALYALVQKVGTRFADDNGSLICRELLGLSGITPSSVPSPRTDSYYKKRPCGEIVKYTAELLDCYLETGILPEI